MSEEYIRLHESELQPLRDAVWHYNQWVEREASFMRNYDECNYSVFKAEQETIREGLRHTKQVIVNEAARLTNKLEKVNDT